MLATTHHLHLGLLAKMRSYCSCFQRRLSYMLQLWRHPGNPFNRIGGIYEGSLQFRWANSFSGASCQNGQPRAFVYSGERSVAPLTVLPCSFTITITPTATSSAQCTPHRSKIPNKTPSTKGTKNTRILACFWFYLDTFLRALGVITHLVCVKVRELR